MSRKARNKQQPVQSQEGPLTNGRVKEREKTCTGEGRSVDIQHVLSVMACREKRKENNCGVREKKPHYCKLKGLFYQRQEVLNLERRPPTKREVMNQKWLHYNKICYG